MNDAFVQALADMASESLVDLSALRTQCMVRINAGGGEIGFLTNGGLNGKMAAQECRMDAATLLAAVNQAMRINGDTQVGVTYVDFSGLK